MSEQVRAGTWLTMEEVVCRENLGCGDRESTEESSDRSPSTLSPDGLGLGVERRSHAQN